MSRRAQGLFLVEELVVAIRVLRLESASLNAFEKAALQSFVVKLSTLLEEERQRRTGEHPPVVSALIKPSRS
jgi:hypothetical protein